MVIIELYRKYLYNSLVGKNEETKKEKLIEERNKLVSIVEELDTFFYGDKDLVERENNTIYALIKRDIALKLLSNEKNIDAIVDESKFYLNGVINEINGLNSALSA